MVLIFLLLLVIIFYILYCYNQFKYWDKKNVPNIKPLTPAGNLLKCFLCVKSLGELLQEFHNKFKSTECKYGGVYFTTGPVFLPVDVDLIKQILIYDFEYFGSRTVFHKYFPFYENIYNLEYNNWKSLRPKLTEQFSNKRLKSIYKAIYANVKLMLNIIETNKTESINMTNLGRRYTLDSLQEFLTGNSGENLSNENAESGRILNQLLTCRFTNFIFTLLKDGIRNPGNLMKGFMANSEIIGYFTKLAFNEIKQHKANGIHKNNFMNNLITTMNNKSSNGGNYIEIASQLFAFYAGGYNTISFNLAMCLYVLGNDQYLQDNARREVLSEIEKNKNKLKYESVIKLELLEGIVLETFRMYPVDIVIQRTCLKNYKIPGSDLTLNKGTHVLISLAGFNFDPGLYPDPNNFNPYRFVNKGVNKLFHLNFGCGPRECIGSDFGMLVIKTALASILRQYKIAVNVTKTGKKIEIEPVTKHYMFQYKNEIWVDFENI